MAFKKGKISVAIATFNEEENIEGCLSSVSSFAHEIIIVDGGSTDNTVEIAYGFGAKVIRTDNPSIFHINKQKALDACIGEWILQLDADEQVSKALAHEIRKVVVMSAVQLRNYSFDSKKMQLFQRHERILEQRDRAVGDRKKEIAAFFLPRKNYFLGHPMTYAGTYPDGVIRLVKNGKARFPCKSVHEQIQIDGKVAWLENDLLHFSNPTWKRYWLGAARYTSLVAVEMKKEKPNSLPLAFDYLFIKPLTTFFSLFIRHKGFLDGIYGFLFSVFSASHYKIAYFKYLGFIKS